MEMFRITIAVTLAPQQASKGSQTLTLKPRKQTMSLLSTLTSLLTGAPDTSTLAPIQLKELMAAPGSERPVLVDVRTPGEWKGGHIQGAKHIDVSDSSFSTKVGALPRDGKYVLYCLSGGRSGRALSIMKGMGFQDVRHLGGGIGTWKAAGYPVAK